MEHLLFQQWMQGEYVPDAICYRLLLDRICRLGVGETAVHRHVAPILSESGRQQKTKTRHAILSLLWRFV